MINIRLYKNFIKDLSGVDFYDDSRVHSIVGFHVLALDNSSERDDECFVFYERPAEFVNIDNKCNKLYTNLYTGDSESISQAANFKKFIYIYEVLHETENPTIVDNSVKLSIADEIHKNENLTKLSSYKSHFGENRFRIAFDIYNNSESPIINNGKFLSSLTAYEGFRPVIDIHKLKVFTNLISVTIPENSIVHAHDLGVLNQISIETTNKSDYRNYSVNSLTDFKSNNSILEIDHTPVCYEDWNLINLCSN